MHVKISIILEMGQIYICNSNFKCFLNADNELFNLSLLGRAFHTVDAAIENSVRVR